MSVLVDDVRNGLWLGAFTPTWEATMYRRAASTFAAALSIFSFSHVALGQQAAVANPALRATTVDAAALGAPGGGFLQYSMGDKFDYNAAGGFAFLGGSLRASYQHAYQQRGYGLGYARTAVQRDFGMLGTGAVGVDVFGAYMTSPIEGSSRGARFSIPLSLRWGSPSRLSVAPYVAPFVDFGREAYLSPACSDFACPLQSQSISARSTGLAAGLQINAWRLGLNLELRNAGSLHQELQHYRFTTGVRIRF